MDRTRYLELEARLVAIFRARRAALSAAAVEHFEHYVEHGELELAYEGLVLAHAEEGVRVAEEQRDELFALGLALGLDREAVYRVDFWPTALRVLGRES